MEQALAYEVVYSKRKTLAVSVAFDGRVVVRAPRNFPKSEITRFLQEKQDWIAHHVKKAGEREKKPKDLPYDGRGTGRLYPGGKVCDYTAVQTVCQTDGRFLQENNDPGAEDTLGQRKQQRQFEF